MVNSADAGVSILLIETYPGVNELCPGSQSKPSSLIGNPTSRCSRFLDKSKVNTAARIFPRKARLLSQQGHVFVCSRETKGWKIIGKQATRA